MVKVSKLLTLRQAVTAWRQDRNKAKTSMERLAVLQRHAAVVVVSDGRTTQERREAFWKAWTRSRVRKPGICWVCRMNEMLIRHHVIQLQNGGNSGPLNIEKICDGCHRLVHPWMV